MSTQSIFGELNSIINQSAETATNLRAKYIEWKRGVQESLPATIMGLPPKDFAVGAGVVLLLVVLLIFVLRKR